MKILNCPTCHNAALNPCKVKHSHIQIDQCPDCLGMWFEDEELSRIIPDSQLDMTIDPDTKSSKRHCPQCSGMKLQQIHHASSGITIDLCKQCHGVWLDHGELQKLKSDPQVLKIPIQHKSEQPAPSQFKQQLIQWIDQTIKQLLEM